MRIFVTGFGPFGSVTENPSATLAETSGHPYEVLEVAYAAADAFVERIDPDSFDVLLMIGVAVGRHELTPELFARNWKGSVEDVHGVGIPGPIEDGQPLLIESTLWNPHLLAFLEVDLGLHTSLDAGSYLCNYLSYRAIRKFPDKRVGFLHIPAFEKLGQERQQATLASIIGKIVEQSPH